MGTAGVGHGKGAAAGHCSRMQQVAARWRTGACRREGACQHRVWDLRWQSCAAMVRPEVAKLRSHGKGVGPEVAKLRSHGKVDACAPGTAIQHTHTHTAGLVCKRCGHSHSTHTAGLVCKRCGHSHSTHAHLVLSAEDVGIVLLESSDAGQA